jgi:peroxiredoxin
MTMLFERIATDDVSLEQQLANYCAEYLKLLTPEQAARIERATAEIISSRFARLALGVGDVAPDFALPNQHGRIVRLAHRLAEGPVVLFFYRGMWCPYCNMTLRAYSKLLGPIRAAGGSLLAISPQTPESTERTASKNGLDFEVLSDVGSEIANAFRVAFKLPTELLDLYTEVGHVIPEYNGTDDGLLPIPAAFVIGTDGVIRLAHVDADYRKRLEPSEAVAALCALQSARTWRAPV